jgi:quercetin dioxygenase-like cupin family protein
MKVMLMLARRQVHKIEDAGGMRIVCRSGTVWITVDGDATDYVLERGETFVAPPQARALVYALADARIDLVECQSRKLTMQMFRKFQPMPLTKAAR